MVMEIGSGGDTPEVHLTARTSRSIYPQCIQKYADPMAVDFPEDFGPEILTGHT